MVFKLISLILVSLCVLLAGSCDSPVGPPPPSLTGDYEGIYLHQIEDQAEQAQLITWRFTSTGYHMRYDEENGEGRKFCDNVGEYELVDSMAVLTTTLANLKEDSCPPESNPEGEFAIFQPNVEDDTLRLVQIDETLTVTIKLVPVFE